MTALQGGNPNNSYIFFLKKKQWLCLSSRRDYWTLKKIKWSFFSVSDAPIFLSYFCRGCCQKGAPFHSCGSLKLTWWILNQKSFIICMYERFTSRRKNIYRDLVVKILFHPCLIWHFPTVCYDGCFDVDLYTSFECTFWRATIYQSGGHGLGVFYLFIKMI